MANEIKDPELWKMAEKRTTFKYHVLIYFIMNIFFWTIWYISLKNNPTPPPVKIDRIPWPVWPMIGWGIAVFLNYIYAYKMNGTGVNKNMKN